MTGNYALSDTNDRTERTKYLTVTRSHRSGCGEYFNHAYGIARSHVGKHRSRQRHCLLVAEMVAKNFSKNARGFWMTEPHRLRRSHREGDAVYLRGLRKVQGYMCSP